MAHISERYRLVACIGIIAGCLFFVTGCSGSRSLKPEKEAPTAAGDPPRSQPAASYYDFGDVLIPTELELDRKASFVFQTPNLTAGVMALKGRVEMNSLIRFFETNMNKDNWRPVSSFKSVRTIMLFQKDNRWCVINISEKGFYTHVEVWVAPTSHQGGQGLIREDPLTQ